jgi:hypothetical protein
MNPAPRELSGNGYLKNQTSTLPDLCVFTFCMFSFLQTNGVSGEPENVETTSNGQSPFSHSQ